MPNKPKTFRIQLREEPPLDYTGELMDCDRKEFVQKAGWMLAIALFQGKFHETLYSCLDIAYFRGRQAYHNQLIKEAKERQRFPEFPNTPR